MRLAILALTLTPGFAFAAGSATPDKPAEVTCEEGLVLDIATQTCMPPEDSTNDDSAMLDQVRGLLYAARYDAALDLLDRIAGPEDMVLTLRGFATRKSGDMDGGLALYQAALALNPDNLLTRSYMGQAFVEQGAMQMAAVQLTEIRMRGGRGGWPEVSLARAMETGETYSY